MQLVLIALFVLGFGLPNALVLAADVLDCRKLLSLKEHDYDISSLAGVKTVEKQHKAPPSEVKQVLKFNLCAELPEDKEVKTEDQVSVLTSWSI
jgi:hypothetical protein